MGMKILRGILFGLFLFFFICGVDAATNRYFTDENYSDSYGFSYTCFVPLTEFDGDISGEITLDTAGTTRINPPSPNYSSITGDSGFAAGTVWCRTYEQQIQVICYSPSIRDKSWYDSDSAKMVYDAGTGLQNAYAVAIGSGVTVHDWSAINGGPGYHKNPYDKAYVDLRAAYIGSDFLTTSSSSYSGGFGHSGSGLGAPDYYHNGYGWGPYVDYHADIAGPNPPQYKTHSRSEDIVIDKISPPAGVGPQNTLQTPIYPAALLFCSTDNFATRNDYIGMVAPTCGDTLYYKDVADSYSGIRTYKGAASEYKLKAYGKGWPDGTCNLRKSSLNGSSYYENMSGPAIGTRSRVCKSPPSEWTTLVLNYEHNIKFSDSCPASINPTKARIEKRNQDIMDSFNSGYTSCRVVTYSASGTTPDDFDWYQGVDTSGSQYGAIASWAGKVYTKYTQSCIENYSATTPPGSNFYCEVEPSQNPGIVETPLTWTTHLYYTAEAGGSPTEVFWPATITWNGSDSISATNNSLILGHTYSSADAHYLNVSVSSEDGSGNTFTALCSNTVKIDNPFGVTCTAAPDSQILNNAQSPTTINFVAYPAGGTINPGEDYIYSWTFNPAPSGVSDTSAKYVNADYTSGGTKTGTVTVTDSLGSSTTTTCQADIIPFEVSCSPSKTIAYTNEDVIWTAAITPSSGTPAYSWSGTDSLSGNGPTVTKQYASPSPQTKTASVRVTLNGVSKTVSCGSVDIFSPTGPPACIVQAAPSTVLFGGASTISVTPIRFDPNYPVTGVTANCGDSASTTGSDACKGSVDKQTCTFNCTGYTSSGTVSVTLSNDKNPVQTATCTTPITMNEVPVCNLSANPDSVNGGDSSAITISYANFSPAVSSVQVDCGLNATTPASPPACSGSSGTCTFTCSNYLENSVATASLNGTDCSPVTVQTGQQPACSIEPQPVYTDSGTNASFTVNYSRFSRTINSIDDFRVQCDGAIDPAALVSCNATSCDFTCGPYTTDGQIFVQMSDATTVDCGTASVTIQPPTEEQMCFGENLQCLPIDTFDTTCTGTPRPELACIIGFTCCEFNQVIQSAEDLAIGLYEKKSQYVFRLDATPIQVVQLEAKISLPANTTATSATLLVNKSRAGEKSKVYFTKTVSFTASPDPSYVIVTITDDGVTPANFTRGNYIYDAQIINIKTGGGSLTDAKKSNNVDSVNILIASKKLTGAPEIDTAFILLIALAVIALATRNA